VGVVATVKVEEIVVMADDLMARASKKLCNLLDVEDWLALYHVRIMREAIFSAWLGSRILHCLYTHEGVQDYNRIVYMKPILSQNRIATKQDYSVLSLTLYRTRLITMDSII
jgi:hypothetical protein